VDVANQLSSPAGTFEQRPVALLESQLLSSSHFVSLSFSLTCLL
jgi:hypothetical protein